MLEGAAAPMVQINGIDSCKISNDGFQVLDLDPVKTVIAV